MPVRYEILPHRAVHVRMTGAIAPAEVWISFTISRATLRSSRRCRISATCGA